MAYTPTNWSTGDTITASDMNKLENAVANAKAYDAVISIYHVNDSNYDYELSIISGTYEALKAKLMNKEPPVILARVWDELSGWIGATTMTSIYTFPVTEYPSRSLIFTVKMPSLDANNHGRWFGIMIEWDSADNISLW